jgi:hypothetical protein
VPGDYPWQLGEELIPVSAENPSGRAWPPMISPALFSVGVDDARLGLPLVVRLLLPRVKTTAPDHANLGKTADAIS